MINYKKGIVKEIRRRYNNCTEFWVQIGDAEHKAINYDELTGEINIGDKVLLNTTAVDLKLGSGGYHFVVSVNGRDIILDDDMVGHIMKLRYTPLQFSVLSAEEEDSPYHDLFNEFKSLDKMPVVIGELHSMVAPCIFNIKQTKPWAKVAYIMTDGGALPINFSRCVAFLQDNKLVEGTITFGQAFGGDYEAVNIYTALITAYQILRADIAVVAMGPGITGTGTKYGFSGMEQGPIIDAVNTLGGRPVFIPRMSFADKRERHQGISHHSITVLSEIAKTTAEVIIPQLEQDKMDIIQRQIRENEIDKKHKIVVVHETEDVLNNLTQYNFKHSTMGRDLDQEKEFFLTAGAAGYYATH